MAEEWTPLDDLGVEEAMRADAGAAFGRACARAADAFRRFAHVANWDRFLDTQADIDRVRRLPETEHAEKGKGADE